MEWTAAGVVLSGWAESYHAKQMAQHEVMVALDCAIAANLIEVGPRSGVFLRAAASTEPN